MRKSYTRPEIILLSIVFGSAAVCIVSSILYVQGFTPYDTAAYSMAVHSTPVHFATSTEPRRLLIPSIGVDAHIESVGIDVAHGNAMGTPSNFTDVGWYNKSPFPGAIGTAVLDGHVSGKKILHAVFYYLHTLHSGDMVEVLDDTGLVQVFIVRRVATYAYNDRADEVFKSDSSHIRLNLITCSGIWMPEEKLFSTRTVVYTERIL